MNKICNQKKLTPLRWPHVATAVEKAEVVAGGKVVKQVFQFAERHIKEQYSTQNEVDDGRTRQSHEIEGAAQLEQRGEEVGQIVVETGEAMQVFINQTLDKQHDTTAGGHKEERCQQVLEPLHIVGDECTEVYPAEMQDDGEQIKQERQENAQVEEDSEGVGRQVQVGRFLVGRRHGGGIGIDDTFGHAAAGLGEVLRFPQLDDSDEMSEKQRQTQSQSS